MKLFFVHFYYRVLELARQPAYVVMSLILPLLVFGFFGVPNAKVPESAQMLMGSFCCYALISIVLYQLAVQISFEKSSPWCIYTHVLPVHSLTIFLARVAAQIFFAMFAVAGVVIFAHVTTEVGLPDNRWWPFYYSVYLGGLPFAAIGVFLGILFNSNQIISAGNLIYLPLTFAGGLWMPPNILPKLVQDISPYLPTRMYGEIVWAAVLGKELDQKYVWGLLGYFFFFIFLAILFFRFDERKRFG